MQNTIGQRMWQSCLLTHVLVLITAHLKFLLTLKKCNYGNVVAKKSCLKLLVDFKASKISQLGHFLFHRPFNGGYFHARLCGPKMVSASACERLPLMGGLKCRVLVEVARTAVWCPLRVGAYERRSLAEV